MSKDFWGKFSICLFFTGAGVANYMLGAYVLSGFLALTSVGFSFKLLSEISRDWSSK